MAIGAPAPLGDAHRLDDFHCTSPDLTKWLIDRARKKHREGASRCFVVCDDQQKVIGYYALAAGAVLHALEPGSIRRKPDPIPVAVLSRLAVHADWVRQGIGRGLLKDAVQRTLQTAQQLGIRVLLCHAIDDAAKACYLENGFIESPTDTMIVVLSLARLKGALEA